MILPPTTLMSQVATPQGAGAPHRPEGEAVLRAAAQAFEAAVLAEMLRAAGVGRGRDSFGGGAGEAQVAGMMADIQAARLAERGGIGLAEAIFEALRE